VLLDWNMPGSDGIDTLRQIRQLFPSVKVVMCSSLTRAGASITNRALEAGACDFVSKPFGVQTADAVAKQFAEELTEKLRSLGQPAPQLEAPDASLAGFVKLPAAPVRSPKETTRPARAPEVLAIGTSTGGPAALSRMLPLLPPDFPLPVVIVQHMPPHFTRLLAERLSKLCQMPVVEAEQGMIVRPGTMLLAPGDFHMQLVRNANQVEVQLNQEEPVNSCRPAVDVLFESIARTYRGACVAAVLTGMGQDGLRGVRALKDLGSSIVVQDRESSVVWGMPGAIAEAGLADSVLSLDEIVPRLLQLV
jgi:two-component system chemotaxis response regulator CheB